MEFIKNIFKSIKDQYKRGKEFIINWWKKINKKNDNDKNKGDDKKNVGDNTKKNDKKDIDNKNVAPGSDIKNVDEKSTDDKDNSK